MAYVGIAAAELTVYSYDNEMNILPEYQRVVPQLGRIDTVSCLELPDPNDLMALILLSQEHHILMEASIASFRADTLFKGYVKGRRNQSGNAQFFDIETARQNPAVITPPNRERLKQTPHGELEQFVFSTYDLGLLRNL